MRLRAPVAALLLMVGCSSPAEEGLRLTLLAGGAGRCSGVRVNPDVLLTAKHCGFALTLHGEALHFMKDLQGDIAAFSCPKGHWTPTAIYNSEFKVQIHLQSGSFYAQPVAFEGTTMIVNRECYPGDSGSPVTTEAGVVAIVSRKSPGFCYADLIEPL